MVITSAEYQKEQKQPLREKSYVFVYMGLINQIAKSAAQVTSGLTDYSNVDSAFRTNKHEEVPQYATLEDNFTKVNGSNAFLPRSATFYDNRQGIIVSEIDSKVRITFRNTVNINIKGFTIDFGEQYPTEFTIENNSVSHTYTKSDDSLFSCEDQFDSSTYIDITPISMVGGSQRLRILSLEFGVGLSFNNEQIISTQRRNSVSHISDTLPLKAFDFTISNLSRKFSQDNPRSFSNYIQQGQLVEYSYGRDIVVDDEGNTEVYMIPGGHTYIKTWSSNDMQAKFSTVGRLDLLDSEYYKGQFYSVSDFKTLYSVAEDVLQDAGFTSDEYVISDYLKSIDVFNPLPIATHKACLQMIASASRSVLREDREGRICIESAFIPDSSNVQIYAAYDEMAEPQIVDEDVELYNYASLEEDYTRVDNTMHFRPRSSSEERTGYVSTINDYGTGLIEISYDVHWTSYGMTIEISEFIPTYIEIQWYREGGAAPIEDITYYWDATDNCYYNFDDDNDIVYLEYNEKNYIFKTARLMENFSIVEVRFQTKGEKGWFIDEYDNILIDENENRLIFDTGITHRIHINHILMEYKSGYTIENIDLKEKPTATSLDLVKQINVNYFDFLNSEEKKQLANPTVVVTTPTAKNIVKLSNACYSFSVLWDDGTEDWNESKTYALNDIVKYRGFKYKSKANNNTGHNPYSSSTYWLSIDETGISISDAGAYFVELAVTNIPSGVTKALVYGRQCIISISDCIVNLNDIGTTVKLQNQLIDNKAWAQDVNDYIQEYNQQNTEYTISYRGEPALDCNDLVYLENQFVDKNLCLIEEEEISTAIGMSLTNSMKLRRISYELN